MLKSTSVAIRTFRCHKGLFSSYKDFSVAIKDFSAVATKDFSVATNDFPVAIKDFTYNHGTTRHKTIYDPTAQYPASV